MHKALSLTTGQFQFSAGESQVKMIYLQNIHICFHKLLVSIIDAACHRKPHDVLWFTSLSPHGLDMLNMEFTTSTMLNLE